MPERARRRINVVSGLQLCRKICCEKSFHWETEKESVGTYTLKPENLTFCWNYKNRIVRVPQEL